MADSPIGGAIMRPSCAWVRPRLSRKSLKLFGKTISALARMAASERRIENFSIFVKLTTGVWGVSVGRSHGFGRAVHDRFGRRAVATSALPRWVGSAHFGSGE